MKLVDNKTGQEICHGDIRETFTGKKVRVLSYSPSRGNGKVHVEHVEGKFRQEYFPHVIGARIEFEEFE